MSNSSPVYNPGQPYMLQIPGGFSPGKIAHITGTFSPNASSIVIKFQTGPYGDPNDEVGLCMYGRFSEGLLGCNALTKTAGWGQEQSKPTHFLARGQSFDITILCDPCHFKIAVGREHFLNFNHQLNPASLTQLNVASGSNDITLNCIWIENSNVGNMPPAGPQVYSPHQNLNASSPYGAPNSGNYENYQNQPSSHKDKGLMGMVTGAGAAVAGALGGSHLLGKSKGGSGSHGFGGYPSSSSHGGGYPSSSSYGGGYPSNSSHGGGYPSNSSHGGGMMNKALGLGGGMMAAKTAKKGFGGSKMLKYGLPLAGVGLGGYMLTKGLSRSFDSFDCDDFGGGSSSDCCDSD